MNTRHTAPDLVEHPGGPDYVECPPSFTSVQPPSPRHAPLPQPSKSQSTLSQHYGGVSNATSQIEPNRNKSDPIKRTANKPLIILNHLRESQQDASGSKHPLPEEASVLRMP